MKKVIALLSVIALLFASIACADEEREIVSDQFHSGLTWYTTVSSNGYTLYGYVNKYGDIVVSPQYTFATDFDEDGYAKVSTLKMAVNSDYQIVGYIYYSGLINSQGEEVFPLREASMVSYDKSLNCFCVDNWFGQNGYTLWIDDNTMLNETTWDDILIYGTEGILPVKKDGYWGYLSADGELITQLEYTKADRFYCGIAAVSQFRDGHEFSYYINRNGERIIESDWAECTPFVDGGDGNYYACVCQLKTDDAQDENWLIIDQTGKVIRDGLPSTGGFGEDGLARIALEINGKTQMCFVKTDGSIIQGGWDYVWNFDNGVIGVYCGPVILKEQNDYQYESPQGGKWGVIDSTGALIVPIEYDDVELPYYGEDPDLFWIVRDGKYGIVDNQGRIICEPTYDQTRGFYNGYAAVRIGNKWGYIQRDGQVALDFEWDKAGDFTEDQTIVWKDGMFFFIDKTGEVLY